MRSMIIGAGLIAVFGVWIAMAGMPVGYAQSTGSLERGKALFEGHCASCHGISGDGAGPEGTGLTPPPTNFRSASVMSGFTDSDLEQAILAGKPNTAMRGYGTVLSSSDVADLVGYLRSFSASP